MRVFRLRYSDGSGAFFLHSADVGRAALLRVMFHALPSLLLLPQTVVVITIATILKEYILVVVHLLLACWVGLVAKQRIVFVCHNNHRRRACGDSPRGRDFPNFLRSIRRVLTVKTQVTPWLDVSSVVRCTSFFLAYVLLVCLLEMATIVLLLHLTASRKISLESSFELSSVCI